MDIKSKSNEEKKEILLKEASAIFEDIGYEMMKIAELSKTTKISVGKIYALFDSKESLYLAYIEHQIENFLDELDKRTSQNSTPEEKISTFIELKFSYYHHKRKAIEQSATNNPLFFNTLYSENTNLFDKLYRYLSSVFMELNSKLDEKKAISLAFGINGFSDGYISQWLEIRDDLMAKSDEVSYLITSMIKVCNGK